MLEVQRDTGVTPPALLKRPPLRASNNHYLNDFYLCSASRADSEVGPQKLTNCDIEAFLNMTLTPAHLRPRMLVILRALDDVLVRVVRQKIAASKA